jgi:hypothetical protein
VYAGPSSSTSASRRSIDAGSTRDEAGAVPDRPLERLGRPQRIDRLEKLSPKFVQAMNGFASELSIAGDMLLR